jgi:hypothetical protein
MGLGLSILNQREVLLIIIMFNNGVYSYNVNLNYDWRLRLGLEAGYGSKNFNFTSLYSKIKLM